MIIHLFKYFHFYHRLNKIERRIEMISRCRDRFIWSDYLYQFYPPCISNGVICLDSLLIPSWNSLSWQGYFDEKIGLFVTWVKFTIKGNGRKTLAINYDFPNTCQVFFYQQDEWHSLQTYGTGITLSDLINKWEAEIWVMEFWHVNTTSLSDMK